MPVLPVGESQEVQRHSDVNNYNTIGSARWIAPAINRRLRNCRAIAACGHRLRAVNLAVSSIALNYIPLRFFFAWVPSEFRKSIGIEIGGDESKDRRGGGGGGGEDLSTSRSESLLISRFRKERDPRLFSSRRCVLLVLSVCFPDWR